MAATAPLYARPKSSERALHQSKLLAAAYALKLVLTRETYTEKPEGWSRELVVGALATVYTASLLFAAGPKFAEDPLKASHQGLDHA
jgi:hypothetical protein